MERAINIAFNIAGAALLTHLVICWLMKNSLVANDAALRQLFAVPNQRLVGSSGFQLLRVRYYLPWRATPAGIDSLSGSQRVMLGLAQVTGLLVPICALVFLALSAVQALE